MSNVNMQTVRRVACEVQNISDAAEEELGYVKSILSAIEIMATQDSSLHKQKIVNLARCAHWIAENLESNVDHFGGRILEVSKEVH